MDVSAPHIGNQRLDQAAVREFATKVSRYFLEFLETDFKKKQAPRRRIQLKNAAGFHTAVPLRKYETLLRAVWGILGQPVEGEAKLELRIRRTQHKSPINQTLHQVIRQQIDAIEDDSFRRCKRLTLDAAKRRFSSAASDPERYVEDIKADFASVVTENVVNPLLTLLEGHFERQSYSAVESVFELQADLLAELCGAVIESMPTALAPYIAKFDRTLLEKMLDDLFSDSEARGKMRDFFEDFSAADAYQELRDVMLYARTGADSLQVYLYVCELRLDAVTAFPVFYIPAQVRLDDETGHIVFTLDPHLYIHKAAIDYVVQELGNAAKLSTSPVEKRILYLEGQDTFIKKMDVELNRMSALFDLTGEIDINRPVVQARDSSRLKLTKTAYIAAFDRGDESMLNDYEELLQAVSEDSQAVTQLFEDMIRAILLEDPITVRPVVDKEWEDTPIPVRLVAASPLPLNEEQRKVLMAKQNPKCRFITLQGPPGTGKSHTITALAFDCISHGESCLILSDKKEALDVVEEKLSNVLLAARASDDNFPNPILRLGKTGGTYNRLISQSAQEKIRTYYGSVRAQGQTIANEAKETERKLRENIQKTIEAYTSVKLKDLEELHILERRLATRGEGYLRALRAMPGAEMRTHVQEAIDMCEKYPQAHEVVGEIVSGADYMGIKCMVLTHQATHELRHLQQHRYALRMFDALRPGQLNALRLLLVEYEYLRYLIFGFFFTRRKAIALDRRFAAELGCTQPIDAHKRLGDLRLVESVVAEIGKTVEKYKLTEDHAVIIYRMLAGDNEPKDGAISIAFAMLRLYNLLAVNNFPREFMSIGPEGFSDLKTLRTFVLDSLRYANLWWLIYNIMGRPPEFDFGAEKAKLEQLSAVLMTNELDRRFLSFVDHKSATARTLGGVIKSKKQFPTDKFADLKDALPCIIAGIREFAEYVPLQKEIFDVVIIDEASQVSVAQALPAILRAKKVIVLGDRKQFSNVKSAQASIEKNNAHLSDLDGFFRRRISQSADKIERLKAFDVKKSVLDFFGLCTNYQDMLRKHFRGYQELISFSSKHFYEGHLQAIKIRGKPIEDVIRFEVLPPTAEVGELRNANMAEAEYILTQLRELVDKGELVTVGIITPFREQQQYMTRTIFHDELAEKFEVMLKLKIMTFDTCQGEERDIIFYSMVATPKKDLLNFIFPVSLENTEERVEEVLKMQRVNVGFSRARECIHFVLSKPVAQYTGSIGRVLTHYQQLLADKSVPQAGDTDPRSPMERKVLDWITKTPFFQNNRNRLELNAQFSVGDYLRQMDPTYHHPSYRVDFMLRYRKDDDKNINIIIEYDGFSEHFTNRDQVHAGNFDSFYRPQDIERQAVLESYGYKFLRVNRFNLGQDPVETLSERLSKLVGSAVRHHEANGLEDIREAIEGVENGSSKLCRKCQRVLPVQEFYNRRLNKGKGGFGRICRHCKVG